MKLQQEVMQQQKEEFSEQNESLSRQTFERTFFSMLSMHTEIVQSMTPFGNNGVSGRPAFRGFAQKLDSYLNPENGHKSKESAYETWYREVESSIGHYFRTLYNMIRFIDERGGDDKKMYARLVRAQLSSEELKLLFWNGLSEYGTKKFKPLIERYALLKHVPSDERIDNSKSEYNASAFGSVANNQQSS